MARFILDVGNLKEDRIWKFVKDLFDTEIIKYETATIHCIDETNENQFHNDDRKNRLSKKQIETYNTMMDTGEVHIRTWSK